MYQFHDDFNYNAFFWWSKKNVHDMHWAMISKRAQAVLAVIYAYMNKKGVAFPSERTIAILCGITDKYVRQAIRDLEFFPDFRWEYYTTSRGKRSKRFLISLPRESNNSFPFHRHIIESGMWRRMSPSAKALYPVMRSHGYFNFDEYVEREDIAAERSELDEVFRARYFDFCEADRSILVEEAGIHRKSFGSAINDLEKNNLVKTIEYQKWAVYMLPRDDDGYIMHYNRAILNKAVTKSYAHERK